MDKVKFFKGCLPQISLGPFLNTLSHIFFSFFLNIFSKQFRWRLRLSGISWSVGYIFQIYHFLKMILLARRSILEEQINWFFVCVVQASTKNAYTACKCNLANLCTSSFLKPYKFVYATIILSTDKMPFTSNNVKWKASY